MFEVFGAFEAFGDFKASNAPFEVFEFSNMFRLYSDLSLFEDSELKKFANSRPQSFSRSLEHFFLAVGQNIFGNKILFLIKTRS